MIEIIEKAYKVYHDGILNENPNEGYSFDELSVVYAESRGKAKNNCPEFYDHKINGREAKFTDVKAVRWKEYDKIRFKNKN